MATLRSGVTYLLLILGVAGAGGCGDGGSTAGPPAKKVTSDNLQPLPEVSMEVVGPNPPTGQKSTRP